MTNEKRVGQVAGPFFRARHPGLHCRQMGQLGVSTRSIAVSAARLWKKLRRLGVASPRVADQTQLHGVHMRSLRVSIGHHDVSVVSARESDAIARRRDAISRCTDRADREAKRRFTMFECHRSTNRRHCTHVRSPAVVFYVTSHRVYSTSLRVYSTLLRVYSTSLGVQTASVDVQTASVGVQATLQGTTSRVAREICRSTRDASRIGRRAIRLAC
jgi:hypothetical protein